MAKRRKRRKNGVRVTTRTRRMSKRASEAEALRGTLGGAMVEISSLLIDVPLKHRNMVVAGALKLAQ